MDTKEYIKNLFEYKNIPFDSDSIFEEFINQSENQEAVQTIFQNQHKIMTNWTLKKRIMEIKETPFILPNATVGKEYQAEINFEKLGLRDTDKAKFEGLEELGLSFNKKTNTLEGKPTKNGNLTFTLIFKLKEENENENQELHQKIIPIIINPDPKSLWKDLPSATNDLFWKEDNAEIREKLGEKNIVVASKRGRSHQNTGGFREDDFAFKHFEKADWSIVVVSDGAGSSSLSRKGSSLACQSVIEFYENYFENEENAEYKKLEEKVIEYQQEETGQDKETKEELKSKFLVQTNILEAVTFVHKKIKEHADKNFESNPYLFDKISSKTPLEHYHATLIFALFKKYDFGFVILTFGVGDCPIAVLNKNQDEIKLLNKLDVGEFGGGTRFITQSSIFSSKEQPMQSRFNLTIVEDFSYLFLMTDGIYDAKFEVEANLEKIECWKEFLEDLQGKNEEKIKVEFDPENTEIAKQLSQWTDFWSIGNHDDRTLAIIY